MKRILFQEIDFASLPNPPAGSKYIGFDGSNFSTKDETGSISTIGSNNTFYLALNFIEIEQFLYIAPEDFKITSIDLNYFGDPSGVTVTILVNDVSYEIGDAISEFSEVKVNINQVGFIKLNCEKV